MWNLTSISFLIQGFEIKFLDYWLCNCDDVLQDLKGAETKPEAQGAPHLTKRLLISFYIWLACSTGQHILNENIQAREMLNPHIWEETEECWFHHLGGGHLRCWTSILIALNFMHCVQWTVSTHNYLDRFLEIKSKTDVFRIRHKGFSFCWRDFAREWAIRYINTMEKVTKST